MSKFDIIAFREGDMRAFELLFEEYFRALRRYAAGIIDDREVAKDIVLESFANLWKKHPQFENKEAIEGYLFNAAKFGCLAHIRSQRRKQSIEDEFALYLKAKEEDAELMEYKSRLIKALHEEIEKLPGQCKVIFEMLYFGRQSTFQVAEKLQISPKTVRAQKSRAIQHIKEGVADKKLFSLFFNIFFTL